MAHFGLNQASPLPQLCVIMDIDKFKVVQMDTDVPYKKQ
jgi:hypothetical protein